MAKGGNASMKLVNHTDIPTATIRAIINAVRPAGISKFDVRISNTKRWASGRAYSEGSGYHATAAPFIVVRVARTDIAARWKTTKVGAKDSGGYLPVAIGNRIEAVLFVLAHELRHLWQGKGRKPRRRMVWGSRGRMSERDADAWALSVLRKFRRGELMRNE